MFGNAWFREHGEQPGQLWRDAIGRLQDHEIRNGLANLGNDNLQFPANLSQFVSACKRVKEGRPWTNQKFIEDSRPTGKMSRLEWMKLSE